MLQEIPRDVEEWISDRCFSYSQVDVLASIARDPIRYACLFNHIYHSLFPFRIIQTTRPITGGSGFYCLSPSKASELVSLFAVRIFGISVTLFLFLWSLLFRSQMSWSEMAILISIL